MLGRFDKPVRLVLVGAPGSELRIAAGMAREAGAEVAMADTPATALAQLRSAGGDLAMIDVQADVAGFIAGLRAERFAIPVLACGIDTPAERAVAAIRAGARDYVPLPPERELIAAALMTAARRTMEMLGGDPAFLQAARFGRAMAPANAPILICGEKGAGKETMAHAIHEAAGRPGRFLTVECAGVAPDILESELFGHEAGAFQGAVARRLGRLEEAANGTVFLREVAAVAPATQARLLAALRDGSSLRLGGNARYPVTARLIVGTAFDLEARVAEGRFRSDLLTRLSLARVTMPPLRCRGADIGLLAQHFADRLAAANDLPKRRVGAAAVDLLQRHAWPGNVRELEEVMHRAMLLATGDEIAPEDLVLRDGSRLVARPAPATASEGRIEALVGRTMEEVERDLILHTLEHCKGNRTTASTILGISVRTMRNKLRGFIEAGISVAPAP